MFWLHLKLVILTGLYLQQSRALILRNNALINKMVSHFKIGNRQSADSQEEATTPAEYEPEKIMQVLQNVLCKNFPTIPCKMITEDNYLRLLIEKSIQQIKYKKLSLDTTTITPSFMLTLFPTANGEDLSNMILNQDTEKATKRPKSRNKKHQLLSKLWEKQDTGKSLKHKKELKRTAMYGRKKLRKFYPHKVKYKDKVEKNRAYPSSEEKLSMSVEMPDAPKKRKPQLLYKEDTDEPMWRIDYLKHGEPSLNMRTFSSDALRGKLVKKGHNVIVEDNIIEQNSRKDVLHPDVYIKKNFVRKSNDLDHSNCMD